MAMSNSIFSFLLFLCLSLLIMTRADLPRTWEVVVANTGIASMHTVVTRFNTVVLLDRTNIGPSRKMLRKGHCRNDPHDPVLKHDCYAHFVLLDLHTSQIRPLTILTDTWCSFGQFLPDGTLLQSGGDLDGVHIHRDGAGDHAGRCTTSTSSHRPENRVQDDDEGIGLIDVNNGYKMIVVNIGHKIDVNSTKSFF
ncbi:hypothetical protein CsSME_00017302 [Camellia sinensis var. sinensis]